MNYPIPKQKPQKSSPSAATLKGEDGDGVSSTYPLDHGCKGLEWKTSKKTRHIFFDLPNWELSL